MKAEEIIQAECVKELHNSRPETRGLFFSVTNNSEHVVRGMKRKSLGMVAGVSDTVFLWKGISYFIEFKTEKGTQKPDQKRWEKLINEQGFLYFIVRNREQFFSLIDKIMNNDFQTRKR